MFIEPLLLRIPRGAMSRVRLLVYRALGMRQGKKNRMEGGGRVRRPDFAAETTGSAASGFPAGSCAAFCSTLPLTLDNSFTGLTTTCCRILSTDRTIAPA